MIRRALAALSLVAALLLAPLEARAISFTQAQKNDFTASSASLTVTITATTAPSSLLACGSFDSAATSASISDNNSDSVTSIFSGTTPTGETFGKLVCALIPTATNGTTSVKASYSGTAPTFGDLYVWEIVINSPSVDQTPTAGGNSLTATVSTGTLAAAAEAAVAFCASGNSCTLNSGNGWTDDGQTAHTASDGVHQVTSATTALTASWGQGLTSQWGVLIVTLQSTAASATPTRTLLHVGP